MTYNQLEQTMVDSVERKAGALLEEIKYAPITELQNSQDESEDGYSINTFIAQSIKDDIEGTINNLVYDDQVVYTKGDKTVPYVNPDYLVKKVMNSSAMQNVISDINSSADYILDDRGLL